jgi:uncharacterized peroxidase-related enzyme
VVRDWTKAPLSPANQALCRYAEQLTAGPASVTPADLDTLRNHGFDDTAIHDATQVIAYFNYINRIADGLAVEDEEFIRAWGEE